MPFYFRHACCFSACAYCYYLLDWRAIVVKLRFLRRRHNVNFRLASKNAKQLLKLRQLFGGFPQQIRVWLNVYFMYCRRIVSD